MYSVTRFHCGAVGGSSCGFMPVPLTFLWLHYRPAIAFDQSQPRTAFLQHMLHRHRPVTNRLRKIKCLSVSRHTVAVGLFIFFLCDCRRGPLLATASNSLVGLLLRTKESAAVHVLGERQFSAYHVPVACSQMLGDSCLVCLLAVTGSAMSSSGFIWTAENLRTPQEPLRSSGCNDP